MKRKLIIVVLLLAAACSKGTKTFEASMNFDLKNVRPFLESLNTKAGVDLDVEALSVFTKNTKVDEDRSLVFYVGFEGKEARLEYRVLMDDIDSPDLFFLTDSKPLADAINIQMSTFAENLGI